jgi:hypothetical protein
MDPNEFRTAAHSAVEESQCNPDNLRFDYGLMLMLLVINYYDTVQDRRVVPDVEPGYLKKLLPDGPPQTGEKWEDVQKDIETKIIPGLTHW